MSAQTQPTRDQLWWVCAILHPTKDDRDKNGTRATVLVQPEAVVAVSDKEAALIAARKIPAGVTCLDRVEVAVTPFDPSACCPG